MPSLVHLRRTMELVGVGVGPRDPWSPWKAESGNGGLRGIVGSVDRTGITMSSFWTCRRPVATMAAVKTRGARACLQAGILADLAPLFGREPST